MAVDRRLHLRIRHRAAPRRAFAAAGVAGVVVLVLPVELIELAVASIGLSEIAPALAPPIEWGARIGIAVLIALTVAAVRLAFGGAEPPYGRRTMTIAWPRSLRWDSLTRLARGADSDVSADVGDGFGKTFPSIRPGPRLYCVVPDAMEWQPRRRADMHPDAPPRLPIIASRDLPPFDAAPPDMSQPDRTAVPAPLISAPVQDPVHDAARPMPRSPEPLSESQLDAIRDLLAHRDTEIDVPSAPAAEADSSSDVLHLSAEAVLIGDVPLSSLLNRFEQQVERKIAIESRIPDAAPQSEVHSDLRKALETLRTLSQPGRRG